MLDAAGWAPFAGHRVFVLCDIEGGEAAVLDPTVAPALRDFDLLVETHPEAGIDPAVLVA